MKVNNAIKKLDKYTPVIVNDGSLFSAAKNGQVIEFYRNGRSDDICCVRLRRTTDKDDIVTDYSAGVFCDNITQAIKVANW